MNRLGHEQLIIGQLMEYCISVKCYCPLLRENSTGSSHEQDVDTTARARFVTCDDDAPFANTQSRAGEREN